MPTFRPITSRADRQTYHRFRYAIYAESVQRGFLNDRSGTDLDEFDDSALHLGWYAGDELVGCVRLLKPIPGPLPLHLFKFGISEETARRLHTKLLDAAQNGRPFREVSRLCLAPHLRGLTTTRQFVLSIIATAHRYGIDHCLFTCDQPHAAFWQRMGFRNAEGLECYSRGECMRPGCLLEGHYGELLRLNRADLQEIGVEAFIGLRDAA